MAPSSIIIAAFLGSYALTWWLLRDPRMSRVVDQPNIRSSHSIPTPRGGGLSMVAVTTCGVVILYALADLPLAMAATLLVGGLSVAAVGLWDDVRSAPIALRMAVHFGAAVLAIYYLYVFEQIPPGEAAAELGWGAAIVSVVGIVWVLNLFNFMDGIDGIAASEGAFVLLGGACLGLFVAHAAMADVALALVLGAASLGFLKWNWPSAAIFMGDVGSGYLGYAIAVIALEASRTTAVNLYAWVILGGVFLVDATVTLARRLLRRERVYQAHRTHAYQWLARRWGSHLRVTLAVIAIDLLWLLPCAALAVRFPTLALRICIIALAPLVLGAILSGAGRAESVRAAA